MIGLSSRERTVRKRMVWEVRLIYKDLTLISNLLLFIVFIHALKQLLEHFSALI
jgi:hypothetical protein